MDIDGHSKVVNDRVDSPSRTTRVEASYIGNSFRVAVDTRVVNRGRPVHWKKFGLIAKIRVEGQGTIRSHVATFSAILVTACAT